MLNPAKGFTEGAEALLSAHEALKTKNAVMAGRHQSKTWLS